MIFLLQEDNLAAKMLSYNRANRAVAILCNHQRAVPKTHDKAMENLDQKLEQKQEAIKKAEKELKHAKKVANSQDTILGPPQRSYLMYFYHSPLEQDFIFTSGG